MEDLGNPYVPPQARLEGPSPAGSERIPLFTPAQVAGGTFLGGPLAGIYFLHSNFKVLGKEAGARHTAILGALFVAGLLALLPFLPSRFPNYAVPLAYTFAARGIVEGMQMKKTAILSSGRYTFESNWKVALVSLLGLLLFLCLVGLVIFGIAWIERAP